MIELEFIQDIAYKMEQRWSVIVICEDNVDYYLLRISSTSSSYNFKYYVNKSDRKDELFERIAKSMFNDIINRSVKSK